jgi:glyoxylase-like metal-dependent hydrolase (beta-lactamase superfamily II)
MRGRTGKMTDIPPGGVRSVRVGFTAIYLVPCAGGYLQIDTGYGGEYETFRKKLDKIGIPPSRIKYLFLTHHHDDHAGFSAELIRRTNAVLIVHKNAVAPLASGVTTKSDMRAINLSIRTIFSVWSLFHRYVFPPVAVRERDIVITGDDDHIPGALGIDGKILYTPGHNDESISLVLADGSAFVGDTAANMFGSLGARHRPPFVKDPNELYRSWEKLRRNGARVIYPTHGKPFDIGRLSWRPCR